MLNILRNHQTFLKWFYHVLLYPSKVGDIQFLYNFCQYLVYGQFYNLSDLIGVSCYLIAIWNWIFLITSDAEHPFCFLPSVHCHWLSVCSNNLPIFKQFFVISLLSCERSLPFLYKNHLSDICFARYQFATCFCILIRSDQISRSVVSDSLWPHESQHARPPCPSPTPGVHWDSRPSSQWCHTAISSSVVLFSSCPQSLPASGSFPMSQLFAWGGQSTGVSASASFLPKKSQG